MCNAKQKWFFRHARVVTRYGLCYAMSYDAVCMWSLCTNEYKQIENENIEEKWK